MAVFVVTHIHILGYDITVYDSIDKAYSHVVDIARKWWDTREDENAPDDYSSLMEDQIVSAYFDGNKIESYSISECEVE